MSSPNSSYPRTPEDNRRKGVRLASPDLAAFQWTGSSLNSDCISDISSTGVYLRTEERWPIGAMVTLTLQRNGQPEATSERPFAVQARVARWGVDGMGLAFVLPEGMDLQLWQSQIEAEDRLTEPEAILREFRLAGAIAFLSRICPSATNEVRQLLRETLGNRRDASAVEIAQKTEKLLVSRPYADRMLAHPQLVVRILENGSWAEDDWMQQLWARLLAASCTVDGQDQSNLLFVDLFSKLTVFHARILAAACTKSTKVTSGPPVFSSRPFICTAEELIAITNKANLLSIDRDLAHLSEIGLIAKNLRSSTLKPAEKADITPTPLGLELYSRCTGHRS